MKQTRSTTPFRFQSAPDPKAGRNIPPSGKFGVAIRVSIRSRPEGREEPGGGTVAGALIEFQSAPDPKAGRNDVARKRWLNRYCFNPLPTRRPGGTRDVRLGEVADPVSIRSRPEGREEPRRGTWCRGSIRFQSAPDPKAGRNVDRPRGQVRPVGFNPLPTRRPGGTRVAPPDGPVERGFNPLPTRRPGGTISEREVSSSVGCFNPLPTRRPGGTRGPPRCS